MRQETQWRAVSSAVARILQQERSKRGLSLAAVAEKAGISRQMVSFVEQEKRNPTLDTLLRICSAMDLDFTSVIRKATRKANRK